MKTKLFLSAAVFILTCLGCSEDPSFIPADVNVESLNDEITTEYVWVRPSGSAVHALDGSVMLEFPPGAVATPTRYKIVSFPVDHELPEGLNLMLRVINLENITNKNQMQHPVTFTIRYDLCEYKECSPDEDGCVSIYEFLGDRYAFHGIRSIGECCMDCSVKTVSGCIQECGSFVVCED